MTRQPGTASEPVGATPMGAPTGKKGIAAWLVPLGLAVLAVVVLLLLLSRCGGGDDDTTATSASTTPSAGSSVTASSDATATSSATNTATSTATAGGAAGGSGSITVAGTPILPLSSGGAAGAGDLATYTGQDATSTSVEVESVPADEGFWVGSSPQDRIWVQLSGAAGESPFTVKAGDRVAFTGKVAENPSGFAASAGVTAPEGAAMLEAQGHHIVVLRSALKLAP